MNYKYHHFQAGNLTFEFTTRLKPITNWNHVEQNTKIFHRYSVSPLGYDLFLETYFDDTSAVEKVRYVNTVDNYEYSNSTNNWYYWDEDIAIEMMKDETDNLGRSFLLNSIINGDKATTRKLLDLGVDVKLSDNAEKTPLHCASAQYDLDLCKELVSLGALINCVDNFGQTPLHCCCQDPNHYPSEEEKRKQIATFEYLLGLGLDINSVEEEDSSPLILANFSKYPNERLVEFILNNGGNIEQVDNLGNSALVYALQRNHLSCIEILLKNGEQLEARNKSGKYVLEHVQSMEAFEILEKYITTPEMEEKLRTRGFEVLCGKKTI